MQKVIAAVVAMLCVLALTGCSQAESRTYRGGPVSSSFTDSAAGAVESSPVQEDGGNRSSPGTAEHAAADTSGTQSTAEETDTDEWEETDMIHIQIGEHTLKAELEDNSSARAFADLLAQGPVTVQMHDYAGMEKVGTLPTSLPQNNEQLHTVPGDLILYQGNSITIYYDTNSWSLTRLGKLQDVTQDELKDVLGTGDVEATFSVE